MKTFGVMVFILIISAFADIYAQGSRTSKYLSEAIDLYKTEKASGLSHSFLINKKSGFTPDAGGYISYASELNTIHTLYYDKSTPEKTVYKFTYDAADNFRMISVDSSDIGLTPLEKELIDIRKKASALLKENPDDFFTAYPGFSFKLIPVSDIRGKRVYIVSEPLYDGSVVLGGDYLLKFSAGNTFVSKEKLHDKLYGFPFKRAAGSARISGHIHTKNSHFTVTELMTLLLHQDKLDWNSHGVVTEHRGSFFKIDQRELYEFRNDSVSYYLNEMFSDRAY
ncbi:hypothetical protein AB2B38_013510 [Balneola sp. MJW-20]|uniref:hypothetical protein n=1 Tax=Gracilimonas aurantiaca TaxID=3234185 RepID=UPI003465CB00